MFSLPPIILKEILLEFGFIEEMRTTWGNEEVPQIFFPQSENLATGTYRHNAMCFLVVMK